MPMTVVVTRDVDSRYRGFLASVMLEISPGIYTSPKMSKAIRQRVWQVVSEWHDSLRRGSIVMTWADSTEVGGQGLLYLGEPPRKFFDADGVLLTIRN